MTSGSNHLPSGYKGPIKNGPQLSRSMTLCSSNKAINAYRDTRSTNAIAFAKTDIILLYNLGDNYLTNEKQNCTYFRDTFTCFGAQYRSPGITS